VAFEYSPHAPVDIDKPEAWGICDRCAFRYLRRDLHWQFDYRGNALANLRILVCDECTDTPNDQFRPIIIGPDPVPVKDPRPGWYYLQNQGGYPVPILAVQPGAGVPLLAAPGVPLVFAPGRPILGNATANGVTPPPPPVQSGPAILAAPGVPLIVGPGQEILE
jgi:hypothetical protein